ncbi:MAG TPA: hypothetical protein PLK55_03235 [archaeon]|jgi:hypothetical protein|nr:hypothetical protein [archaeon]HOZ35970.1 hypothetical protein [archaeon]
MRIIKKTTRKIKNKIKEKYKLKPNEKAILKNLEKIVDQRLKEYMRKYSLYLSSNPRINPQPQLNMEAATKELNEAITRYNRYRKEYGLDPVNYKKK